MCLYNRTGKEEKTSNASHTNTSTVPLYLFSLGGNSYAAGEKRIFCFEAADSSSATLPTTFLAPATNELGAAGFYDVIGGAFHGEANESASTALTFSDGIGSADDYKHEGGTFSAKFHAYASDTEKGSVAFGSTAASGTAEAWVARGTSVTLTATPAAEFDFVSWSGDTWAITSGSTESLTITVKSDTAVQLLATFKDKTVYTWTGAANESEPQWFTLANWVDDGGNVPSQLDGYSNFVFPQSGDVTVNYNPSDASFRIKTVTFESGAGKVTVTGAAMARVFGVVCRNGQANELQNAVAFCDAIDVTATSGSVTFAGGATGNSIVNHQDMYGHYNVTASQWDPATRFNMKSGCTLSMPNGTFYNEDGNFYIENGATATVKVAKLRTKTADVRILQQFNGVFKATEEVAAEGMDGKNTKYFTYGGNGLLDAKKFRVANYAYFVPAVTNVLGSGGIQIGRDSYVRVYNSGAHYFGATADWAMWYNNESSSVGSTMPGIYKHNSTGICTLTFDTSDYYDRSVGRTISSWLPIGAYNTGSMNVVVQGGGSFVFANTTSYGKLFSGGLTAKDSATIVVRNNSRPGAGNVTLQDSARLVVPSGKITLGGTLTFGAGTSLVVSNLTAGATAPVTANSATAAAGARIVVGGTTQLKPGKYPVLTLSSAEAAATVVPNLALDATAVTRSSRARLVAKDATVYVNIPWGFIVIIR